MMNPLPLHELDIVTLRTPLHGHDYLSDAPVTLPAGTRGTVVIADAKGEVVTVEFQNPHNAAWVAVLADLAPTDLDRVPLTSPADAHTDD